MMEQVRLCAVWPTENWLASSLNHIQGWATVRESYSRVLEQGPLLLHRPFPIALVIPAAAFKYGWENSFQQRGCGKKSVAGENRVQQRGRGDFDRLLGNTKHLNFRKMFPQ